ncbi:hypothetical protein LY76DRAFT_186487 [Colletotrichum caudatum]|nr:hypothetical protein LY76DRAFT_186487 [Colletotrichum caudatum]
MTSMSFFLFLFSFQDIGWQVAELELPPPPPPNNCHLFAAVWAIRGGRGEAPDDGSRGPFCAGERDKKERDAIGQNEPRSSRYQRVVCCFGPCMG